MNHFIMRYLYICSLLFVSFALSAQEINFQRAFELESRDMLHGSMSVASDGAFFNINLFEDREDNDLKKFHITKHSAKGDLMWAFDYRLVDVSEEINFDMDILATLDKGVVFTIAAVKANEELESWYSVKLDGDGVVQWTNELKNDELTIEETDIDNLETIISFTDGMWLGSDFDVDIPLSGSSKGLYVASVDNGGLANWAQSYAIVDSVDSEEVIIDSKFKSLSRSEADFTTVVCGNNFEGDTNFGYVTKLDTAGMVIWSKSFSLQDSTLVNPTHEVFDVAAGPDSTTVIVGSLVDNSANVFQPFVVKVDTIGNVIWGQGLNILGGLSSARNTQVTVDNDGGIIVGGRYSLAFEVQDYLVKYDADGDLIYEKTYPRINSWINDLEFGGFLKGGELQFVGDGFMYSGNAINFASEESYPFVVKTNLLLEAMCHEQFNAISDTLNFVSDTLVWFNDDYLIQDSVSVHVDTSINYSLPVLVLPDIPYCPQETIDTLLIATQPGAIAYEWESGETTDTLRVTEEGEYIVTVTMDTLECFVMCDTALISVYDFPTVAIVPNFSQYCTDGTIPLAASGNNGNPPFTIEWSTGDIGINQIITTELGAYSVTVTDACQNTAASTFTITDNILPQPVDPVIDFNQSFFCTTGQYQIAILNSNDYTNIEWSTGETDVPSIIVPGPGDYSVTATNCLEEVTGSISADGFSELEPLEVEWLSNNETYCENMSFPIDLTVTGGSEVYMTEWSTGQTGENILVPGPGEYIYTVTDDCENQVIDTVTLGEDLIPAPVDPILELSTDSYCTTNLFGISIVNEDEFTDIQWSNGQSNVTSIFPSDIGEYTVTALSCFQEVTAQQNIGPSAIPEPIQPILDFNVDSFCITSFAEVELVNASVYDFEDIMWSNGQVGAPSILVGELGEYSVTSEDCNQEVTASITVTLEEQGDPLEFPNTFMPNSSDDNNRTFGPYVRCPNLIEDYEFKVFDRWGALMHEADRVEERWNGVANNKNQPNDVYFWYARYTGPEGEVLLEGDVTLVTLP